MTPRPGREWTEEDVRVRASRRGSRPRSKRRPSHDDAVTAQVVAVDRGRYTVLVGAEPDGRPVTAVRARELHRRAIVVGDEVAVVGDLSGAEDTLARIVRIEDRRTVLMRTADDRERTERLVVANADRMLIVTAAADPEPRPRLVDRYLVAGLGAGIAPALLITKTDLADPGSLSDRYRALGLPVFTSAQDARREVAVPDAVRDWLDGHFTVLVGHSGVGKSTLVNALVPDAERATGHVNETTGRGRHTSSSAVALRLPDAAGREAPAGWVVDTPGIRSLGLAHIEPADLLAGFPDLAPGAEGCPRGCDHAAEAPECALDAWVAEGHAGEGGAARLDSFRRLLASRGDAEGSR